jgi:predicted nucleic acid-binding protein
MVVLDTNVIVDHLRQSPNKKSLLMRVVEREGKENLFISVITLQELYEGKSTKDRGNLQSMLSVLAPLSILNYDTEIAELAGAIARDLKGPIEFADAAIAATCVFNGCDLLTLNEKHFKSIPHITLYTLDS